MGFVGSAPNKIYQRTDNSRTGSAVNVEADNAGVADTAILADNRENDIAAALTTSLQVNGDNQMTANLQMNSKRIVSLAQGTARTDGVRVDQCQDGDLIYASVGGTADAIELTLTPAVTALVEGMMVLFIPGSDNTTAVTIDTNSLGTVALEYNSAALTGGELQAGQPAIIAHDGDNWQLVTTADFADLTTLASTSNGDGAALIGIEDSGGLITETTVEGALAENRAAIDAIEDDYLISADIGTTVQTQDAGLEDISALTPTKGNLIAGDGSNWVARTVGSNGQQVIADSGQTSGLNWANRPVAPVAAGALSAQATLDIALGSADMYEIEFINMIPVTDDVVTWVRLSQSSSFLSGAGNYGWGITEFGGASSNNSDTKIVISGAVVGNVSSEGFTGTLRIYRPSASSFQKRIIHYGLYRAYTGDHVAHNGGGTLLANTNAVDGLRFMFASGNIASGYYAVRSYSFT